MALSEDTLTEALTKVFRDMKNAKENAKDTDFSDGLSKACKDFAESGSITTVDGGALTSGAGVFAGGGSGSISVTQTDMSSPIVTAMNQMKNMRSGGDSVLAEAIFNGLKAMIDNGTVKTDVTGATTSPMGVPGLPPFSGSAEGTMTCTHPTFVNDLKKIFSDMNSKRNNKGFDGDAYLAEGLAGLVNTFISSGTVSTSGKGAIAGTSGGGSIA